MRAEKQQDTKYRDSVVDKVTQHEDGRWTVEFDGGGFVIPEEASIQTTVDRARATLKDNKIEPKVGMTIRVYGDGLGHPIRGVDLDGVEVYYRTEQEQDEKHRQMVEDTNRKKKAEYEEKKEEMQRDIDALPEVFRARFTRFRNANPDFGWEFEDYELFACKEAVKIAAHCETKEELEAYMKLPYDEQKKAGISDGHSGNTFGHACRLAHWYITKPENVTLEHGALVALVGCEAYGCEHPS